MSSSSLDLHGEQVTQGEEIQRGQHGGQQVAILRHGRADDADIPDAGGRRDAVDSALGLQNGAAADEADSSDDALDDAGLGVEAHVARLPAEKDVAATGHGHHGKRAHADAVRLAFPIPSDG